MPDKTYKQNMRKKSFMWSCNVCRVDETPTKEKANINVLTREEMPDTKETMNEGKVGDLKIIHMNTRSILNKIEELNIICEDLQPDVLSVTETWMDDSIPSNSYTPPGYKVIRKDRNENFKQKYGKNNSQVNGQDVGMLAF